MFKLIRITSRAHLEKWVELKSEFLSLHEENVGLTLAIEMDVGLQIVIWGSDEDMLIAGINHLAEKQKPVRRSTGKIEVKTIRKEVRIREPVMPSHWMGKGMGYAILSDGVVETYEEAEIK